MDCVGCLCYVALANGGFPFLLPSLDWWVKVVNPTLNSYVDELRFRGTVLELSSNKSVNADAQSRSAAAPRRSLVAGYVRR
jgi:hypothetical protein